ncbi:uncharacterized protein F5147DRAFT_647606 [Suillus discolor]|uniref:Uncharacterized protein n=1 Tax=Suillus discolor TaxID=1912936 RepID=A0A9P7FKL5_9AGAM|nr:uncharacterized protein F5147DRAFT_647606 [Suillus discolor]KAG2119709.1 hypothetical protein F5147DRAFT_647606 [Suillus discolor]
MPALVPAPASAPVPQPAPPPPLKTTTQVPIVSNNEVPNSVFTVELNKPTIDSIKHSTKPSRRHAFLSLVKFDIKQFEKKSVYEELMTYMLNVWWVFRDYATNIVQTALNLRLPISSEPDKEVTHKAVLVLELLKNLNFLHKLELGEDSIEWYLLLEAEYFVDVIVDIIWQKRLYDTIALTEAALQNALKAYWIGRFESINASAEQFYDTYKVILVLIDSIRADSALKVRHERLQELIVTWGYNICFGNM